MSKEVRLNDKMWYGKYQGKTIKFILENDRNFLDILIDKGKISYHKNVLDYLNSGGRKSSTSMWDSRYESQSVRYYGSSEPRPMPEPQILHDDFGGTQSFSVSSDIWVDVSEIEMQSGQIVKIRTPKLVSKKYSI